MDNERHAIEGSKKEQKPEPRQGLREAPGYVPGEAKAITGEWSESKVYGGYACVEIHIHPKYRENFLKTCPEFLELKW